ncbi:MAG TPA: amidohydrolase family protein [Candidatus Binatia bacterium]|nr:amidohydrolase family protein [Candidatus Binatia bacterium]
MRIDIHSHTVPAKYLEAIKRDPQSMGSRFEKDARGKEMIVMENGRSTQLRSNLIDPELRLREMAEEQIDVIVESLLPPLLPTWAKTATAVRVCQIVNDAIAEDAARYPGRIFGMGIVPLQDVGEAIRELDRIVMQHQMPSVLIPTNVGGKNFDEPQFFAFFEHAQEFGMLVFIHPHEVAAADRLERYWLTNLIGNPLDTSIAQASLIFGGVLERLPELKVCCAHAGGYSPWIRGRWRHGQANRQESRGAISRPVDEYLSRLYFDTVIFNPAALEFLIRTMGSDHVLLGTDYPTPMGDMGQVPVINEISALSAEDKEKVLGGNAARLLGLKPVIL